MSYLHERRRALGGGLPARRRTSTALEVPDLAAFGAQLTPTGEREISTTMAFVRILNTLLRDKTIGKHVVPIVPDESRTFGREAARAARRTRGLVLPERRLPFRVVQ